VIIPYRTLTTSAALLALAWSGAANAEDRWYGFGAGAGGNLAPASEVGAWVAASAAIDLGPARAPVLAARGALTAFIADGSWAIFPLLSGDVGARLGPLDLLLTGGVQIFGGANREAWTIFSTFGLVGGGGLSLAIATDMRISLRGQLVWIPEPFAAKIEGPEDNDSKPHFLYFGGLLSLEIARPFVEF